MGIMMLQHKVKPIEEKLKINCAKIYELERDTLASAIIVR